MKLTLHKSQVHSYRLCSDELAVQSCPLLCLQWRVAKVLSGLFCSWPLLRKKKHGNKSAKFTLYYGSRRFVAWDWLLNAHVLAGNAARQWHANSGKSRTFILCEKKPEYVASNASTSLKHPLLVRVWPMCLSVKLHLCRLLFMQYKITWLVRIHLMGIRLYR